MKNIDEGLYSIDCAKRFLDQVANGLRNMHMDPNDNVIVFTYDKNELDHAASALLATLLLIKKKQDEEST